MVEDKNHVRRRGPQHTAEVLRRCSFANYIICNHEIANGNETRQFSYYEIFANFARDCGCNVVPNTSRGVAKGSPKREFISNAFTKACESLPRSDVKKTMGGRASVNVTLL